MISKNAERISESLIHVGKLSRYAHQVLKVILIVYLVFTIPVFCYTVVSVVLSVLAPLDLLWMGLRLLPAALSIAVPAFVFAVLMQVFGDISAGSSPFTTEQSKRLQLIGWLLLANVVFGAIASVTPLPYTQVGSLEFGLFVSSTNSSGISIDFSSLLWGAVCFCLSYVFKYGALLQQLSDDTV